MFAKVIDEEEQQRLAASAEYRTKVFQMERRSLTILASLFLAGVVIFSLDIPETTSFPQWVIDGGTGLMVVTAIRIVEGVMKIRRLKKLEAPPSMC